MLRLIAARSGSHASRRYVQTSAVAYKATVTPLLLNSPQYSYTLGLSYASKDSPPFIPPVEKQSLMGIWARSMSWESGGELKSGEQGGWGQGVREATRKWGAGEDFFAVQNVGNDLHLALSDGVGGWSDKVDPSFFSQSLMYHYAQAARSYASAEPREILHKGYQGVLAEHRCVAGGATFVGVRLGEEGTADFVNLGDSGYAIMRKDQVVHLSKPQTHYFNCPVQLSKIPKSMQNAGVIHDTPDLAEIKSIQLEAGDVVILFTDGLSDNLPPSHLPLLSASLTQLLNAEVNSHLTPAERDSEYARLLADILVGYGRMAMARTGQEDGGKGWKTPFEIEATREVPKWGWKGGKIDDITVMTAVVAEKD